MHVHVHVRVQTGTDEQKQKQFPHTRETFSGLGGGKKADIGTDRRSR